MSELEDFKKVGKIISSCQTDEQLHSAIKIANRFKSKYPLMNYAWTSFPSVALFVHAKNEVKLARWQELGYRMEECSKRIMLARKLTDGRKARLKLLTAK